jgi:serine/threonine protein kinase
MADPGPSSIPTEATRSDEARTDRAAPPLQGTVLAERYRLLQPLGRGGMGWVWEAEHLALGHMVAIKLIDSTAVGSPSAAGSERARARFLREARAAAGLHSPHVVQIFDYGVEDDTPYIAMERLHGESLAQRLRREPRLPPDRVAAIVEQIARAVGKAHAAGIVHRDLKPDNVFLVQDEDGERCKVLDFGIAKVLADDSAPDGHTHRGGVLGTPYYMSPEQATNAAEVGPASDLWSMAVIAYECLVGERPFDGKSLPMLAVKLLAEPVPVPSEHAEVPPGFDAWFRRATQRDPRDRFGSARELAASFTEALGGEAMPTVPPRAIRTTNRPRRPWWPVLAPLAIGVPMAWILVDGTREPDEVPAPVLGEPIPTPVEVATPTEPTMVEPIELGPSPTIELRLQGPAGAAVYRDDARVATLPEPVRLPRGEAPVTLRVKAEGFEDHELVVVPDRDLERALALTPLVAPGESRKDRDPSHPPRPDVSDLEF